MKPEKMVKVRKDQTCGQCDRTIRKGEDALRFIVILNDRFDPKTYKTKSVIATSYTCCPCFL